MEEEEDEDEEEEEGRKGAGSIEENEDEGRGKKDMQEKLNKLFSQPADPWASSGGFQADEENDENEILKAGIDVWWQLVFHAISREFYMHLN